MTSISPTQKLGILVFLIFSFVFLGFIIKPAFADETKDERWIYEDECIKVTIFDQIRVNNELKNKKETQTILNGIAFTCYKATWGEIDTDLLKEPVYALAMHITNKSSETIYGELIVCLDDQKNIRWQVSDSRFNKNISLDSGEVADHILLFPQDTKDSAKVQVTIGECRYSLKEVGS